MILVEVDKVDKEKINWFSLDNLTNESPTMPTYDYRLKIELINLGCTLYLANYI